MDYEDFLENKRVQVIPCGFEPQNLNPHLMPYQRDIVTLAARLGKFCIWADCGLGKTLMQLEWAHQVAMHTGEQVLILAPLGVAHQTIREGQKFGIDATFASSEIEADSPIVVTNYEKLDRFDTSRFVGIALDESSILKAYDGKTKGRILEAFASTPYKTAWSATPAPNDYMELGNHAEFVGSMTQSEMLAMFFTHDGGDTSKWRLKGHAQDKFWEWVCSWAVMLRKPSDLGYSDEKHVLPDLKITEKATSVDVAPPEGHLFFLEAKSLSEQRHVRKQSLEERCLIAADLVNESDEQWLIWCDLNDESAMLKSLINGAVEVKGSDKDSHKEQSLIGFQDGKIKALVTKPSIAGFGMNFQSCHNVIFVGLSHSYESFYQAIRRCWRFGQQHPVNAYIIYDQLEGAVVANIKRKERESAAMAESMTAYMKTINQAMLRQVSKVSTEYNPSKKMRLPKWLKAA